MRKQNTHWLEVVGLAVTFSAVAILGIAVMSVLQQSKAALVAVTSSPIVTYTIVPSGTPTIDWVATRDAVKTLVPEVTAIRPTGIFEDTTSFFKEGYQMQNAWQQQVNGAWAAVFAGVRQDDPQQGVIFTQWELPNASIGHFINTPVRVGSVRIIAEQNYRLTLQAADGTLFYFDVPAQTFVSSPTEVAPTITPPPTHTPTQPVPTPCGSGGYPAPCPTPTLFPYPGPTAEATLIP
jgi:hypothetical protein